MSHQCDLQGRFKFDKPSALLVAAQIAALAPLGLAILYKGRLPLHVDAVQNIYHDLAGAAARIMLPAKLSEFGTFGNDAANASDAVGVAVAACGITDEAPFSRGQPAWQLPDDERGLQNLVSTFVRSLHLCFGMHCVAPAPLPDFLSQQTTPVST